MSRWRVVSLLLLLFFSCKEKKQEKELIMVEQSDMAKLMLDMYAFNQSIKQQIEKGELATSYPEHFNSIKTAALTEPSDRDDLFETMSDSFLVAQRSVFQVQDNLVGSYNKSVNACIACHEIKCVGPIPKIKKLLIQ